MALTLYERLAKDDHRISPYCQRARCTDPQDMLSETDAPLRAWRNRMLDLFDGLARSVPAFDSAA